MKNFKNAIFDLDGTLLDSMGEWNNLGRNYLLYKGIINSPDNLNETLNSMSMMEAAEYFRTYFKINGALEDIVSEIKGFIEDKYRYELELKPYAREYLEKMKDENVQMCILSASPMSMVNDALERNNIMKYFSHVITCDQIGYGKDRPDAFYLAADRLRASSGDVIVYDDAYFALLAAKEAGFYTVGVYDDHYAHKRNYIETISDLYIESFQELLNL